MLVATLLTQLCGLALLGEPLQRILLSAEVHLVRRASAENGARYLFIVLTDVERDETPHGHRAVELFRKSQPCFNCRQNASIGEFEEMMSICASTLLSELESLRS